MRDFHTGIGGGIPKLPAFAALWNSTWCRPCSPDRVGCLLWGVCESCGV